jgi:zinc D-Ala-D-Ala carboxypeptidase
MSYSHPVRTTIRRVFLAGLLVLAIALGYRSWAFPSSPSDAARSEHHGPRPAIANLDPALLGALRHAEADAASDGVEFSINSGWRSSDRQESLLQQAVSEYGSEAEAARWVATPETSPHVSGDAVDMGSDATAWLSEHGAAYGLCQIYGNEPWHYELRPEAIDHGCPPTYPDPTYDPRMQQ